MFIRNRLAVLMAIIALVSACVPATSHGDATSIPGDIQSQLKDRTDKLNQLSQEIQAAQNNLATVQKQKNSLQKEVQTLDSSIQVLDLNIKSDTVATQKLVLEIGSLQGQLQSTALAVEQKRNTVAKLFKELQKADDESIFVRLFGNKTLAETLEDAQSIENLRSQLSIDVVKLNELAAQYNDQLGQVSSKKSEVQLHQENLKNRAAIVADQKAARQTVLNETKNQETVYQQKVNTLKAQQDALQDEISRMENQLSQNFDSGVLPAKRPGVLNWPFQNHIITQHFGEHSYLYRGKPHNGLDLGAPIGTPVFAAADGVVMAAGNNDQSATRKYQYGKYVLIRHANNLATLYGHLSRQVVAPGQTIKRGDLLGYSGSTGYATGPHLHFGLYWAPTISLKSIPPAAGLVPVGVVLNPEDYL